MRSLEKQKKDKDRRAMTLRKRQGVSKRRPNGQLAPLLSIPSNSSFVLQCLWQCTECDWSWTKKPRKGLCPDCGSEAEEVEDKPSFEDWWLSLGDEGRQDLLRQHGSHEKKGGKTIKGYKGGGKKGNQHDKGQANAMKQIKAKYLEGYYD